LFWLGLGLSLAVHLAFAFHLLRQTPKPGAVDVPTDAISINLETTDILNTAEQRAVTNAAAGTPAASGEDGKQEKSEQQPQEPQRDLPKEAERTPAADEPVKAEAAAEREKQEAEQRERRARERAEEQKRQERDAEARETERERRAEEREEAEERRREKRKGAKVHSGANGSRGQQASSGRVSASQGAIENYRALVRAQIARSTGGSATGIAGVSFSISPSGHLISVQITKSSGNRAVDQGALAAVRRASPFPPPPKGMTAAQLYFTTTIRIR
jgi:TonB family protein